MSEKLTTTTGNIPVFTTDGEWEDSGVSIDTTGGPVEVTYPPDMEALLREARAERAAALQWIMSDDALAVLRELQRGNVSVVAAQMELLQGCREARP